METFVVRLWSPETPEEVELHAAWRLRGTVEHVRTGSTTSFRDDRELLELLTRRDPTEPGSRGPASGEPPA